MQDKQEERTTFPVSRSAAEVFATHTTQYMIDKLYDLWYSNGILKWEVLSETLLDGDIKTFGYHHTLYFREQTISMAEQIIGDFGVSISLDPNHDFSAFEICMYNPINASYVIVNSDLTTIRHMTSTEIIAYQSIAQYGAYHDKNLTIEEGSTSQCR